MNARLVLVSAALGIAMLAGCKPKAESPSEMRSEAPPSPAGPGAATAPPTAAERKDGAPIQGQIDPREPPQRKDFEDKKR